MKNKLLHRIKILSFVLACAMTAALFCSCSIATKQTLNNTGTVSTACLRVHYLDVGQGDSEFIELPNKKTMLIDAGVSGLGDNIIKYIKNAGYSKIDYLVATHPHADHIGSMAYIVKNFNIGQVYMPKVSTNTKTYENLLNAVYEKNLKIQTAASGKNILSDKNCSADILAPLQIDKSNLNNCSAVIKITYKNKKFLFIGDAEKSEINSIKSDLSADVLKVGHHGSTNATYSKFLKSVNPKIAVISVGKDNDYGHPHKKTLALLSKNNVELYRTDKNKTVVITCDGNTISTQTGCVSMWSD